MALSPMMTHYLDTKKEYPGMVLFYRLGDFYEMFFDDAVMVSKELELTLTGKDCGLEERAPMCGIPYHAADVYIKKLVELGHRVAICEQVEDPKTAKGIVKREVVRIVTPGTVMDQNTLEEGKNNYILCAAVADGAFGLAAADITTGKCMIADLSSASRLNEEISRFSPSEIVCNPASLMGTLNESDDYMLSELPDWYFDENACGEILKEHFKCARLDSIGLTNGNISVNAVGALFRYLYETQKSGVEQITSIQVYSSDAYMYIDSFSRRNLELTETLRDKQKKGSLLWVLDKTRTAMGARLLRSSIERPLLEKEGIEERLDAIEEMNAAPMIRDEIREYLDSVYDLERLISRIVSGHANPRDLIAFKTSLSYLPHIRRLLGDFRCTKIAGLYEDLDTCEDLFALVEASITDDPPLAVTDGGIIKTGYNDKVDAYRNAKNSGKQWLIDLEEAERTRTGIKNLKIKYNKVFGYYLEVTKSFLELVPEDYIRKQTLANAERYTTDRLKEIEDEILGAEDKLSSLEYALFCEVREGLAAEVGRVQKAAAVVAAIDVICSLSYVSVKYRYVRPSINLKGRISIKEGRHPVVERMIRNDMFIPNDTELDGKDNRIAVITGPNMAGKSTYMRQCALIALMAQMGSFVPAASADLCISDRIFTRVGASDDLASGQSTFMVEMNEVSNILRNATSRSLLILDEIGRGTSTFDGLAIAWAVIEYIADRKKIGAKTLFATHYHELTELEGKLAGVRNYCIAVKEKGDDIIFLRKIIKGGADKSYGIQVAKLAGIPSEVTDRAKELVAKLSEADVTDTLRSIAVKGENVPAQMTFEQISLFGGGSGNDISEELLKELEELDLSNMTPIEALNELYHLKTMVLNRNLV